MQTKSHLIQRRLILFNRESTLKQNKPSASDNRNKSSGRASLVIINNETSSPCPSLSEVRTACHFHVLCTEVFESYPEEREGGCRDQWETHLSYDWKGSLSTILQFSISKEAHDLLSVFWIFPCRDILICMFSYTCERPRPDSLFPPWDQKCFPSGMCVCRRRKKSDEGRVDCVFALGTTLNDSHHSYSRNNSKTLWIFRAISLPVDPRGRGSVSARL